MLKWEWKITWKEIILIPFLVFLLFLISQPVWASQSVWQSIDSPWFFSQTKHHNQLYSDMDATSWRPAMTNGKLDIGTKNGIYGWYKTSFDWSQPNGQDLSLFIKTIYLADETWLNGVKIGGVGEILPQWQLVNNLAPLGAPRAYPIPEGVLKSHNNELVIKVWLGIGNTPAVKFIGGVGVNSEPVIIGSNSLVQENYHHLVLKNGLQDGAIILLGLVDLLLIFLVLKNTLRHFPEFKWLLVASVMMFLSAFSTDVVYYLTDQRFELVNWIYYANIVFLPFIFGLYFLAMYDNISKQVATGFSLTHLSFALIVFLPIFSVEIKNAVAPFWQGTTYLLFAYCLISAFYGVLKGYIGARFQLFGFLAWIASLRMDWLPFIDANHHNLVWGSIVMRYSILIAYFLRVIDMSKNYQLLSTNMLNGMEAHKKSIARELHDGVGQLLSTAKLELLASPDKSNGIQRLDEAIGELRSISHGLHSVMLEKYGLKAAIEQESRRVSSLHNTHIELHISKLDIDQNVSQQLLRIVQETVQNAVIHGKTTSILIDLWQDGRFVKYKIKDTGKGFEPDKVLNQHSDSHLGLISLVERVRLLNGQIKITSKLGEGTLISVSLPSQH